MKALLFANWQLVNRIFCALIWIVAAVLAMAILLHLAQPPAAGIVRPVAPGASICTASVTHGRQLSR